MYPNPHEAPCFWYPYAEYFGSPNVKWCEQTLCAFISEPANTWSNVSYMIAALWMVAVVKKKKRTECRRTNEFLITFPVFIFIMGLCSFIYHASNIYLTQVLDFVGMFLFSSLVIAVNLYRIGRAIDFVRSPRRFSVVLTVLLSCLVHMMYKAHIKFQTIVVVLVVFIVITELRAPIVGSRKYFYASLALLLLATGFSALDMSRLWCDPFDHVLQGHAMWHVISALAMCCTWLHYTRVVYI